MWLFVEGVNREVGENEREKVRNKYIRKRFEKRSI